jgi:uncharacterized membrane protein
MIESSNYVNLKRLTFLVDGVFAITMALLVLELCPPEATSDNLAQSLPAMLPRLYIYLIAFYSLVSSRENSGNGQKKSAKQENAV